MKYRPKPTSRFQKDLKRIQKRGYQIQLIKEVVRKISDGETLEPKYKDHPLSGDYIGCRECHITPDWLLIYEIYEDELILSHTNRHTQRIILSGVSQRRFFPASRKHRRRDGDFVNLLDNMLFITYNIDTGNTRLGD